MNRRAALAAILALLMPAALRAQVNDTVTSVSVTTTSGNCLAQNNLRSSLTIDASGASANIGYCEGACTAAIGNAGTTTLAAGQLDYWPAGSAPKNEFCFISASGTQPMTIREGTR